MSGSELKADLWINEYITAWDIYTHGVTKILAYQKTPYQEMYIESGPSFALFIKEYFVKLQRVLNPGGYVMVQAGPISPPEVQDHARLVNTLKAVFSHVTSLSAPTPYYGRSWGFALCSDRNLDTRPDPKAVDQLLQDYTSGGYRFIDGITLLGIMQTPLYIRQAISKETTVYTLEQPPKFFGTGTMNS